MIASASQVAGVSEALYEATKVRVDYPDGRMGLAGVSLRIYPGERVVLLGSNGCGKTTLLKLLNGLVRPSSGELRFEGRKVDGALLKDKMWCAQFRKRVVLVFQHPEAMLFNPTVRDEIAYGLRHLPADEREERIVHWAGAVRLEGRLADPPAMLSGGEKQRLCLACVLALEPSVVLLDEPTANLDPRTVGWLLDWLADRPVTVVVATHQLSLAQEMGERAVILSEDHRVAFDGPVDQALGDTELLLANNLAHRHTHRHGEVTHEHGHGH